MVSILLPFLFHGLVFTFDDGPSEYTPAILTILERHNIKAVFCIPTFRLHDKKNVQIIKEIISKGHMLCNHSHTHPNFGKISKARQRWEVNHSQNLFRKILKYKPLLFRPPCGVITRTQYNEMRRRNMSLLFWDIDTRDWNHRTTTKTIYNRVISSWKKLNKPRVLLFHDTSKTTAHTLEKIILRIKRGKNADRKNSATTNKH